VAKNSKKSPIWLILSRDSLWVMLCVVLIGIVMGLPSSIRQAGTVWTALSAVADGDLPVVSGASSQDAALHSQLVQVAAKYDAAPINARVDSIWRLTPGLNGVRLNIAKTLQNPQATPLVFDQLAPSVGLDTYVAEPIYRGNQAKRQISLMINVAWGTEFVPQILNILRAHHVHATFFLDGSWTKKNPVVAKSIALAGMELGNHAYNHPAMSRLTRSAMIEQIVRTNDVIYTATGIRPTLFAPPSGDVNNAVVRIAAGLKMRTILWTLDTIDWRRPSPATIINRIVPRRQPGAMVLMHPTAPTVAALPAMITSLQRDGYDLVTVSTLISSHRPVPDTIAAALK